MSENQERITCVEEAITSHRNRLDSLEKWRKEEPVRGIVMSADKQIIWVSKFIEQLAELKEGLDTVDGAYRRLEERELLNAGEIRNNKQDFHELREVLREFISWVEMDTMTETGLLERLDSKPNYIKCEDCWFDLCAKRVEGHGCNKGKPKTEKKEDYFDKQIKLGNIPKYKDTKTEKKEPEKNYPKKLIELIDSEVDNDMEYLDWYRLIWDTAQKELIEEFVEKIRSWLNTGNQSSYWEAIKSEYEEEGRSK